MRLTYSEIRTLILVREHIKSNKSHPIRLKELVQHFEIPEKKLRWGFKYYFSHTIHQFYLIHSMIYARNLLSTKHSIKEVALILKYSNTANFRRAFKRFFGHNPNRNPTMINVQFAGRK